MPAETPTPGARRWVAIGLAAVGTASLLLVVTLFGRSQASPDLRSLWPLPGLYLLEIAGLALVSWIGIVFSGPNRAAWLPALPWAAGGALFAFVVLGAWTIGLFLIPGVVGLLAGAWLAGIDPRGVLTSRPFLFLTAALIQAAVIFAVVAAGG